MVKRNERIYNTYKQHHMVTERDCTDNRVPHTQQLAGADWSRRTNDAIM